MNEDMKAVLREYEQNYSALAEDFFEEVQYELDGGTPPREAVENALDITLFNDDVEETAIWLLAMIACLAYGLSLNDVPLDKRTMLSLKFSKTTWTKDKATLPSRLKTVDILGTATKIISTTNRHVDALLTVTDKIVTLNGNTEKLKPLLDEVTIISRRLAEGDSKKTKDIRHAIREVERYAKRDNLDRLQIACNELQYAVQVFTKKVSGEVLQAKVAKRIKYAIDRVVKTELSRAWYEGFMARVQADPNVWGVRYKLNPRHNIYDICDVLADANIGYGKGVYPKDRAPTLPRHPFCMCYLVPVKLNPTGEDYNDTQAMAGIKSHIDSVSEKQRKQLFGVRGAELYAKGTPWQNLLQGWDGLSEPKLRLAPSDFD